MLPLIRAVLYTQAAVLRVLQFDLLCINQSNPTPAREECKKKKKKSIKFSVIRLTVHSKARAAIDIKDEK